MIRHLHGLSRLTVQGVAGTTTLVEQMHWTIARLSAPIGRLPEGRTRGITGLVYRSIHGITGLVGDSLDLAFRTLTPQSPPLQAGPKLEARVAILNGILGDHLEATGNPLAIPMQLRYRGQALRPEPAELARTIASPSSRLLIAAHGLCMSEHCWTPSDATSAIHLPAMLAKASDHTHINLNYNSGRPIADNGRELADLIERLVKHWPVPVEEVTLLGHSMGGLVARSACHHAMQTDHQWPDRLKRMIFLGTPHHGSPLERAGYGLERILGISPYSAPFQRLAWLRSAGITDLRHGRIIGANENHEAPHPQPALPEAVQLHAIAASTAKDPDRPIARRIGDGLVPIDSALGRHPDPARALAIPPEHQQILPATSHLGLLHEPRVLEILGCWMDTERR
ncbi:MAG: alpha/beta fold hydrolase [Wenzhouxiangellaceae bacterium]|nr:alpha/beta fold hydrolase [Wenzhouxiangellaceae bacterium]